MCLANEPVAPLACFQLRNPVDVKEASGLLRHTAVVPKNRQAKQTAAFFFNGVFTSSSKCHVIFMKQQTALYPGK